MQKNSRVTKQRMVILGALRAVRSHPTADELYALAREHLPKISLGTVYRNLDLLVRQGDIMCLESAGSQKRFDGNPCPHHHVRCLQCGRVADIGVRFAPPALEDIQSDNFIVTDVRIEFEGVCGACAGKKH